MTVGEDGFRVPEVEVNGEEEKRPKIELLSGDNVQDQYCATFEINDEDHTIGNPLQYIISKNPNVKFCGYTVPHPMKREILLRIQTDGVPAIAVFREALKELKRKNQEIQTKVKVEVERFLTENSTED